MADTTKRQPQAVTAFFDNVQNVTKGGGASADALKESPIKVPAVVDTMLGKLPEKSHSMVLDSVTAGMQKYEREHGFAPDGVTVEAVLSTVLNNMSPLADLVPSSSRLDSASATHHDQLSLHPSMVMVSIMQMMGEMVPWAGYLPTDAKSNEGRIAIITPQARSNFGDYVDGQAINGVLGGGAYMTSQRLVNLSLAGGAGPFTFQVTAQSIGAVTTANPAAPLLRGRSVVLVNGLPSASDVSNGGSGSGNSTIAGSATVASTSYAISGTVNTDTGAISITSAPALPAGVRVDILVYVDFEKAPLLAPKIGMNADIYKLFAYPTRCLVGNTVDAYNQMQLELNLDPRSQALLAVRNQYNQERHYRALALMKLVAANLVDTWAYDWTTREQQMNRAQIFNDLAPVIAGLSQKMANVTTDHGITHLYVTGELAAQIRGLPSTLFESSGLVNRPGIYRLGRLFNLYEVYYTPIGLTETGGGTTSQVLCIGMSQDTARNPMLFGDAVAPIFLPIAMGQDMVYQDGFYTRAFTELNPHLPSAQGAALINVTGIK